MNPIPRPVAGFTGIHSEYSGGATSKEQPVPPMDAFAIEDPTASSADDAPIASSMASVTGAPAVVQPVNVSLGLNGAPQPRP